MEQFHDRHHVRLRSRQLGTYLYADENGLGVSLDHRRASVNAAWAVNLYPGEDEDYLLLYSAAYGRYLAAADAPARRSRHVRRVLQRHYEHPQSESLVWYATLSESGDEVFLHNFHGGCLRYLGRNNDSVCFYDTGNATTMMLWVVEHIPPREGMPPLPPATVLPFPAALWELRVIQYVRPDVAQAQGSFWFFGRSVFRLRNELARRLDINAADVVMCLRTDVAWVIPLLVDLPRNHQTLLIEVLITGTPAHAALLYPDVDAE